MKDLEMPFGHPFAPLSTSYSQVRAALFRAGLRQQLVKGSSLPASRFPLAGGSCEPRRGRRGLRLRAPLAHVPTLPAWSLARDLTPLNLTLPDVGVTTHLTELP